MDQPQPAPYSRQLKVDETTLEFLTRARFKIIEKLKETTITDEVIRNLEPHPSDYRLVYFASEVYEDDCTIPDDCDWKLLIKATNKSRGNGYVGAAFFNPLQQQIIIAHRGTNSLNAAWTDLKSIFWGSVSSQISSALTFSDFIRDVIVELQSEKKWRYQLSFTGHSLGGFLAQITTFGVKYLKRYEDVGLFLKSTDAGIHSHCVTFDNPGCAEMLNKITDHCDLRYLKTIFPNALDMTAYLSAPNMVNTCNRHVGVVMRLKLSFQEMSSWSAKTPLYHLETHKMANIKSVFDPNEEKINVEVEQMFDWPVAYGPSDETRKFFKIGNKKTNFIPDTETSLVSIGEGRFNKIRYLPKRPSIYSYCNVALFSEDELFLLKHWLKIVESSIKIDEKFTPLNLPFRDLFFRFKQSGDALKFHDKTSMKETIKRCKQIFRWYPEEIKNCLKSVSLKSHDVIIMQVGVDSYKESIKKCKVDFIDSIELEDFLEAEENILTIKANVENREIEMLRLFNIFKQIRLKQSVKIDKYTGENRYLFVNQSYLLMLFKYTELDLLVRSQLKLLVVDLVNETVDGDVSKLIKGFAKNDRKVVIISSTKEKTALDFKFTDLTEDSRKNVLEKYEIIKLGNETYTLQTFLKTDDENWAEKLTFLNDYEFLDRILNDRCIELKNDSLNLSKLENFYIQADDEQNYSFDDFVKLTRNSDYNLDELRILITHVCDLPPAIEKLLNVCGKLRTADLDEASQYFKERCDEESSRKFYWFHYDGKFSLKQIYNPTLYIPRSFNEMVLDETKITISIKEELLRQEEKRSNRVTVELTKTNDRSLECSFKVKRKRGQITYHWDGLDDNEISDVREFLTISRDGSLEEQELADRRLVLITGDPGIGKSTTVTNILTKIERSWIFKLTYDDCTKIVKNLNGKFEVDQISKQLLRIKSNNQSDLLKYHLAHKTPIKVVFLFDEVFDSSYDQNYEDRIIKFLKYLCDETESFVIVTARETKREMIENDLNTCSIKFKQLDRQHVEGFLTNYWSELFHFDFILNRLTLKGLDDYTKRLLAKAEEIFHRQILNFIGIPLQIKLLAEVAAPNYVSLSQQSSNLIPLELPDNLTGIYEVFVEKKLAIVCKKSGVGESYSVKKLYLESIEKKLRAFSASKYRFYDDNFGELETLQQTGLIQGSEFIHQTIQEFYFACQIFAWLKKRDGRRGDKQPKLEVFLMKVFSWPVYSIVRMFLETYISKIIPEDAPFYSRKIAETLKERQGKKCNLFKTMALDRLIWEHCQGIIIFLLESWNNHCTNENFLSLLTERNKINGTVLYLACQNNQTLLVDYFLRILEAQSKEIQNEIICTSFNIYHSSFDVDIEKMLNAIENFIARVHPSSSIKEIADFLKNDIGLLSDLGLAVKNGSLEAVRDCLTNVRDAFKPRLLEATFGDFGSCNALSLAVKYGHAEIVRLLIEHGSDVNQGNFNSMTPIALAAETGNIDIIRYLIENGGDYMKKDKRGVTPFYRAAEKDHADIVEYFLEELKYEQVNEKDSDGNNVLHYAAMDFYDPRVLDVLLKHDRFDVNAKNHKGMRPLDYAINTGDFQLVETIVEAGAAIDCEYEMTDNFSKKFKWISPICRASETGNIEILRYLIENGADYKKGNDEGITPFHRAAAQSHADVVIYFLEELKYEQVNEKDSIGGTALHYAVKYKRKSVLEILLKHDGIDVNAKNHEGMRPLDYAIITEDFELVEAIVKAGAAIDCEYEMTDNFSKKFKWISPICRASETGNIEILRYLIENGADYKKGNDEGITPFHRAAAQSHADVVIYFLEELKYEQVNEKDSIGGTALHYAVRYKRKSVLEILLKHDGIDVNAKNRNGMRSLDYAINTGDFELVEAIVKAGAAIDCEYEMTDNFSKKFKWISPICRASETGNIEILRYLIENGADYKKGNDEGITPFHRAAAQSHADVVIYFLEELKYEQVNEKDSFGGTALHYAVRYKRKSVLEILLKHDGIDVNAKNRNGMRSLDYAINTGDFELVEMIVEAGAAIDCEYEMTDNFSKKFKWIPPICRASETGNLEILRYLIENGGDYTKKDKRGVTPFYRAAEKGHADIVEYFLEELKYEQVNEKDSDGNNVLHYAAMDFYDPRVLDVLLKHDRFDVNAKNHKGMRPLDYAINTGDFQLVETIVEAGAAIDCEYEMTDNFSKKFKWIPPICRASETGNIEILRYLIENGADYKKKDNRGVTPFHRAAAGGNADMVTYFLEELKHEEVNEKDADGNTALHYAVKSKRKRVVEILLKHDGIDVNAKNRFGDRPLDYAIEREVFELVEIIVEAGETIDYVDNYGVSPIERAKIIGREDIVEYLIKSRSNESKVKEKR